MCLFAGRGAGVSAVRAGGQQTPRRSARRIALRLVMRIVMPLLMLGLGVYTVANFGLQGLVSLLPILAAHVVGFLVIFPLWMRYRQRRAAVPASED